RLPLSCAAPGRTHYMLCFGGTRENERNRTRQGAETARRDTVASPSRRCRQHTAQAGVGGKPPDVVVPGARKAIHAVCRPIPLSRHFAGEFFPGTAFFLPGERPLPLRGKELETVEQPMQTDSTAISPE